jgi:hypothetical protein
MQILRDLEKRLEPRVVGVLRKHADRLKEKLRADEPLKSSGSKRFPYLSRLQQDQQDRPVARIFTPVKWGAVHIGPAGTSTTILPKRGRFLAIPTEAVRQMRGHPVGPRQYSGTVIFGGIIWGRAGWGGGRTGGFLKQRRAAGEKFSQRDLIPLYILKGSVVVRRRIHPERLIDWVKVDFLADLKKVLRLGGD